METGSHLVRPHLLIDALVSSLYDVHSDVVSDSPNQIRISIYDRAHDEGFLGAVDILPRLSMSSTVDTWIKWVRAARLFLSVPYLVRQTTSARRGESNRRSATAVSLREARCMFAFSFMLLSGWSVITGQEKSERQRLWLPADDWQRHFWVSREHE